MLSLPDGPRQILAGLLASAVFLLLFFPAGLAWWAALALGVLAYFALLLLIPRRKGLAEVMVSDQVSAADLAGAAQALTEAVARLTAAAKALPRDELAIGEMTRHLTSIRALIQADPRDFRQTRQFIGYFLPQIVLTVESYTSLAKLAQGENEKRLQELGETIKGFGPVVEKIDQACIENDFTALEAQVSALQFQLKRV